MRFLKMLGLAVMSAWLLTAFVGASSASGAVACKTDADPCTAGWSLVKGDPLTGSLKAGTEASLKAAFAEVRCKGTHIKGEITDPGGAEKVVKATLTEINLEGCTCGSRVAHVTPIEIGSATVNDAGTVTGFSTRFTANCTGLAKCIFGTVAAGTDIGKVTDTTDTLGGTGMFHAEATLTWSSGEGDSGQFVCAGFGDTGSWKATYELTSPDVLWLSAS